MSVNPVGHSAQRWQDGDMDVVDFGELRATDLVLDRIYKGGKAGNRGDDPISKIVPVGNAGGFRFRGSPTENSVRLLVLYTSSADADWPDMLDLASGTFTYYGDNKRPGRELHNTPRKGNRALRRLFEDAQTASGRSNVPPILLFFKAGPGADVVFRGLLVPGAPTVPIDEQLVAIWRSAGDQRFQNYRATFSVLDVPVISRAWINDIVDGKAEAVSAPAAWKQWRRTGIPQRLLAPRSIEYRTREQQLPQRKGEVEMLARIHAHFAGRPHDFEDCAAQLWMMLAPSTDELIMTQRSRDGGRDAIGKYRIGPVGDQIRIDFALEAKCYAPHSSVGVKEMSRLISRLRHRNFGVLVTTSWLNRQAYKEIREDQHPIAVVAGADIIAVLKERGWGSADSVSSWLNSEFAAPSAGQVDVAWNGPIEVQLTTGAEVIPGT